LKSVLSWRGNQAADRSVRLPFDVDDAFSPRYPLSVAEENDATSPVRLPETRRAASSGLRLIGLGKRPSGASGGKSAMKYIGLGRKRASAIKYIGLGRRSDGQQQDVAESHGAETYEKAALDENVNGDVEGFRGGSRRRRDAAMRLIGIGRRSDNYHPSRHFGSRLMTSPIDEEDSLMADDDRQEMAELASIVGLPWHQVTRRAGLDGNGLRRMQLRRWSASSSSTGSHVDPALLAMGIGK